MTEVFSDNDGRYGYRRITDELHAKDMKLNYKTVSKLEKPESTRQNAKERTISFVQRRSGKSGG
ncbi:MAG: IS3 family transposase [Christensenellaceae bacterium]